jgi:two-component system phosphate regulon sensor histidine kinase PhoR
MSPFWKRPRSTPQEPSTPPPDPVTPLDIIAALDQGVMAVAPDRKVTLCNDAMASVLNRPPAAAVGRPLWEVLRHREIIEAVDRILGGGPEEVREVSFPVPTETIWRFRARPLAAGALLTFADLTNIRRLETVRKDFVANVSHELKTPLTSLRAALETLLDGALEDPAHGRDFLSTALEQVERLQRLIEDLLVLSRLERHEESARTGRSALQPAARRILDALRPLAEKAGIALEARLPDEPVVLALPEDELAQVLTNLLDNAIKFNRKGGRADLAARVLGAAVEISVSDTGVGIPPEDQPRIFERFYRVDKARSREVGGTGLGLAIVKHVVENRRGSVRLESAPGRGSTFTVTLPIGDVPN